MRVIETLLPKPKSQRLRVRLRENLKAEGLLFHFCLTGWEDSASYGSLHVA